MRILLAAAFALGAAPLWAEGFRTVDSRAAFLGLVEGKSLTRFGITLDVGPGGTITGRAFGRTVRGAWRWEGTHFCRELTFGADRLDENCQVVQVRGQTLRFTADRGAGDTAVLRLE